MSHGIRETAGRFPTFTDLSFYQSRREPRWASKIIGFQSPKHVPNIDHVVNAHAGVRLACAQTHNLLELVRGCMRRGENVKEYLLAIVQAPCATDSPKRQALAKKWAARLAS